jgi:hypothetical protein
MPGETVVIFLFKKIRYLSGWFSKCHLDVLSTGLILCPYLSWYLYFSFGEYA